MSLFHSTNPSRTRDTSISNLELESPNPSSHTVLTPTMAPNPDLCTLCLSVGGHPSMANSPVSSSSCLSIVCCRKSDEFDGSNRARSGFLSRLEVPNNIMGHIQTLIRAVLR